MIYADTDFFLALLKENDWLQKKAIGIYERSKGEIVTSVTTVIELLLLSRKFALDPERLLVNIFGITSVEGIDKNIALAAAHYIKHKEMTTFDAIHAAWCGDRQMVSSDKAYDTLGLLRIPLEK